MLPEIGSRSHSNESLVRDLKQYTQNDLTYGKNKLVALSGIAKHLHQDQSSEYLAGLWTDSSDKLLRCLLWSVSNHDVGSLTSGEVIYGKQVSEYRARSWSWASLDGQIDFDVPQSAFRWTVEIISAKTTLKTSEALKLCMVK
jgi:hypothetical protein